MRLNKEQTEAVACREGAWLWLATAGSGKTTVLTERVKSLIQSGTPINEILALTFTTEAAKNMSERVGLSLSKFDRYGFRTFHSFGLRVVESEKDRLPFRLADNMWESMNGSKIFRAVIKERFGYRMSNREKKEAREFISKVKRTSVTLPDNFKKESIPNSQMRFMNLYHAYNDRMRSLGYIDYDDMVVLAVELLEKPDIRARWQFKWVHCDEAQDTDNLQFRLLQLISERDRNVFVVGDINQCQPPNTLIRVLSKESVGNAPAEYADVPIQEVEKHKVISWTKEDQRCYAVGREVLSSARPYSGNLIKIASNGCETVVTPNHWLWVRLNESSYEKRIVYLMWREDLGFRVGTTWLRNKHCSSLFKHRAFVEKADKFWILSVHNSRPEAEAQEQIVAIKYGIPYCTFEPAYSPSAVPRTKETIKSIFDAANPNGGYACLQDFERDFSQPWCVESHRGYFRLRASNLLSKVLSLPTPKTNKSAKIDGLSSYFYQGPVYSLNVQKDHTYVADGIPVGNSMYSFRGAVPENLERFSDWFPNAQTRILPENFRSTPEIVEFSRKAAPVKNELVKNMRTSNPSGATVEVVKCASTTEEVEGVLLKATGLEGRSAILARTNQQIGLIETACTEKNIKFHLLGKSGFWKSPEIKNVVNLCAFAISPDKAETYPQRLVDPYRNVLRTKPAGEALDQIVVVTKLEELYANEDYDADDNFALENLKTVIGIAQRFPTLVDFLVFANKAAHASRKSKHAITLGTIHSAKGLEWENVFVIGVQEGKLPHDRGNMREEQCVYYVSVSRPAKRLFISYVGRKSRFLEEQDGLPICE